MRSRYEMPQGGLSSYIVCLVCALLAAAFVAAQRPSGASASAAPPPRLIHFSGFDWTVKSSDGSLGPGPNFFSDSAENVWVDQAGHLHLRIRYREGRWWCAEIICTCSPGLGTYSLRLPAETAKGIDRNAVLGFFNWSDEAAFAHREIDYELSLWGQKNNMDSQFVVQPYEQPGHISRFKLKPGSPAALSFSWLPDRVLFKAIDTLSGRPYHRFEFRGEIPPGGAPRLNLWLLGGQQTQSGGDVHVVVDSFSFQPIEVAAVVKSFDSGVTAIFAP
jgi:hypothetical protein